MVRDRSAYSRYYWTPRFLAALVVLLPLSLQRTDFRAAFGRGLSVATNKTSPAYAAFEDLHQNYKSTASKIPDKLEPLSAGNKFQPSQVIASTSVRSLNMKGIVIRSHTDLAPQPFYVAGEVRPQAIPVPATLSLQARQRHMPAQLQQHADQWMPPTAASKAQELVAQELSLPAPVSGLRRDMRSITGNPIIVAKADTPIREPRRNPDPILPVEPAPQTRGARETPEVFVSSVTTVTPIAEQMRPLWLNGQIEMTGGLAFIGSTEHTLVVKRVANGEVLEKGRIWINEGRFEIFVKTATGQLVAELLGQNGRVLGRGEMNLVHIKDIPTRDNRIYDIRISLRPMADSASLRTVSGYSHGQQVIPVREARVEIQDYTDPRKVNDEGYYNDQNLSHDSSFVARAMAPQHWSTLVVGQAEHPQDIRLFSNKLMDALIAIELNNGSERKEANMAGVVWGQVKRDGKAAAGASVEMAGNYKPIYLNEMYLPDTALTATSSNGLFAFINVRRGVQALRVSSTNRMYPAQVFPTEDRHVSYVELSLEDKVVTQFKVLDVMNMNTPVEARIRLVGTDDIVSVKDQGLIEYSNGANPFMVEAEAGMEYEISRVTLTGRPQIAHIPMIRHDWLTGLFNQQNILALPGRGMIVGFIDDQDFEIELTGYGTKERPQIVYFDAHGLPLQGKNGVAGGGFVVFNAPMGLQTLFVHPLQSKDTFAQVVVAEPEYVHVMTWSAAGAN